MRRPLLLGALASALACASASRVAFDVTDSAFRATPGPEPRVYFTAAQLPAGRLRSVGVISVVSRGDAAHAGRLAAKKGSELGCWILIEHAAYERLGHGVRVHDGFVVVLAHGAPHIVPHAGPEQRRVQFDCVVRDDASTRA